MRTLVSIKRVEDILPIPDADRLEIAVIGGWNVVVQKETFKKGDLGFYFEIDSFIPTTDPRFDFLKDRCYKRWISRGVTIKEGYRIKTVRLRGVVSQGLLVPVSEFPEHMNHEEGIDLTILFGVEHFDEVKEKYDIIIGSCRISGNAKGNFPSFIPKTDEDRLQSNMWIFNREDWKKELFEASEKNDGSSCTIFYSPSNRPEDPFGVCSRNMELKEDENNMFWKTCKQYNLQTELPECCRMNDSEFAIQGELVGPGVNGNRDQHLDYHLRVFRIYDITKKKFVSPEFRYSICRFLGLEHVKVLREDWAVFSEFHSIQDFLEFVKGKTDNGFEREGVVWKNEDGSKSFKVINNDYLLKEK